MSYLKCVWFWIYFPIATIFYFAFVGIVKIFWNLIGMDKLKFSSFAHRCCISWARTVLFLMPGWNKNCDGFEHLPKDGESCVVVANHESTADIWSIYTLGFQFRWLSKASMFKYPAIGQVMGWAGYIPIERGVKESHKEAMDRSSQCLKAGIPMLFFPEGSRSKTGELRPFKMGAFKLALDNDVPIVPIALKGSRNLVSKGTSLPGKATVKVKVLPKVLKEEGEDVETFAARTREIIKNELPHL